MAFLEVQDLYKKFEATNAVDGISLQVSRGEILVLLGPSGCGKSTFLRLLAGLVTPDSGVLHLNDLNLETVPPHKRNIAMVFQSYALYPHMTARENMGFALRIADVPIAERNRIVENTARLLDITSLLNKKPAACSGGERQRIALGRAIVRDPALFLFDEPLSNLDAGLRELLRVELRALLKNLNATAIYVTHDQAEAMTLADRVAVMENGKLRQLDTPAEVYDNPQSVFVASFLGKPRINEFRGVCSMGSFACENGFTVPCPKNLSGDALMLVRPERLLLAENGAIRGRVLSVEYQGDRSIVHFEIGSGRFAAIADRCDFTAGATICLTCRPDDLLWFDTLTGARLACQLQTTKLSRETL